MTRWTEGDMVIPVASTGHPEDPAGEVIMITANGARPSQVPPLRIRGLLPRGADPRAF